MNEKCNSSQSKSLSIDKLMIATIIQTNLGNVTLISVDMHAT